MSSVQVSSPCSDRSSRSEWFRKSVLFWSKSTDATNDDNQIASVRKSLTSLNSSRSSLDSLSGAGKSEEFQNIDNVDSASSVPLGQTKDLTQTNDKPASFGPSELLRQVEELENCFLPSPVAKKSETKSPHLTLEFPDGSSIKDNPLYIAAEREFARKRDMQCLSSQSVSTNEEETRNEKDSNFGKKESIDHNTSLESVELLLDIVETAIESGKRASQISSTSHNTDDNNASIETPPTAIKHDPSSNENESSLVDNNLEHTDDKETILKNNNPHSANKNTDETETVEMNGTLSDNSDIDTNHDRTDNHIIDSIQKVQDTLLEISREIHYSQERSKQKRDPNDVLRTILSHIKPPELPDENCDEVIRDSLPNDSSIEKIKKKSCANEEILTETLLEEPSLFHKKSEKLFKQIDELIKTESTTNQHSRPKYQLKNSYKPQNPRERLDSGLHSTSSDSNSPHPSPIAKRSLPEPLMPHKYSFQTERSHSVQEMETPFVPDAISEQPYTYDTILESWKENLDSVFHDDSDFSSDWSPISTLDSKASSTRARSNSVPRSPCYREHLQRDSRLRQSTGSVTDHIGYRNSQTYDESELNAIRKFLTLTTRHYERNSAKLGTSQNLEELTLLPSIKKAIEEQQRELLDQRIKQEEFLEQLGDLLVEIVSLKEEHTTVRTKQAKALSLLKKQLDIHKKQQLKAHSDVIEKVSHLNHKLNSSLSSDQITKVGSSISSPILMTPPPSRLTPINRPVMSSTYGQLVWKVTDVMKKLTRVKSGLMDGALVSQPFQTSEYGYKMNSWLYLNGRGKMAGKYLSLYVCVLVGEYDPILTWPIQPTYRLTLIDQKSDISKRHDHVKVRRVLDIAGKGANIISQVGGIPRPNDGTKALIVGFDDFIAHEQLLERRYLADDVLFLKIEAEV